MRSFPFRYLFHTCSFWLLTLLIIVFPSRADSFQIVGGTGGSPFEEAVPSDSYLVGFACTLENYGPNLVIRSLQPIHRKKNGTKTQRSSVFGEPQGKEIVVEAPPGYAVGGMRVRWGDRVDGMNVTFMKIEGQGLNPKISKESIWVGGKGGNPPVAFGGNGKWVAAVKGRSGISMDALGLVMEGGSSLALQGIKNREAAFSKIPGGTLSEKQIQALPKDVQDISFSAQRKNGGIQIQVPQPAYFLLVNGVVAPGRLLSMDSRKVRCIVNYRYYEYPSDWFAAIDTIHHTYYFDRDLERFEIADLNQLLAMKNRVDKNPALSVDEAIQSWRDNIQRQQTGWDRATGLAEVWWKVASEEQKKKVIDFGMNILKGWGENIKGAWHLSRNPEFIEKLLENEVRITGKVIPRDTNSICWKGEAEGNTVSVGLDGKFSFKCQKNTHIEIWIPSSFGFPKGLSTGRKHKFLIEKDTQVTISR